ncbi:hypothetical protein BTUL_0301g00040 [Botrytis tulipae]|uniref:Uncharacterized protein n=1 Tax=Botrytis tulipae TaxID=87230 RepID=A0A4Z1E5G9_9HELO|nr:hypothetical protein BTUL_0301g00040 [Botrytis tulipae]
MANPSGGAGEVRDLRWEVNDWIERHNPHEFMHFPNDRANDLPTSPSFYNSLILCASKIMMESSSHLFSASLDFTFLAWPTIPNDTFLGDTEEVNKYTFELARSKIDELDSILTTSALIAGVVAAVHSWPSFDKSPWPAKTLFGASFILSLMSIAAALLTVGILSFTHWFIARLMTYSRYRPPPAPSLPKPASIADEPLPYSALFLMPPLDITGLHYRNSSAGNDSNSVFSTPPGSHSPLSSHG